MQQFKRNRSLDTEPFARQRADGDLPFFARAVNIRRGNSRNEVVVRYVHVSRRRLHVPFGQFRVRRQSVVTDGFRRARTVVHDRHHARRDRPGEDVAVRVDRVAVVAVNVYVHRFRSRIVVRQNIPAREAHIRRQIVRAFARTEGNDVLVARIAFHTASETNEHIVDVHDLFQVFDAYIFIADRYLRARRHSLVRIIIRQAVHELVITHRHFFVVRFPQRDLSARRESEQVHAGRIFQFERLRRAHKPHEIRYRSVRSERRALGVFVPPVYGNDSPRIVLLTHLFPYDDGNEFRIRNFTRASVRRIAYRHQAVVVEIGHVKFVVERKSDAHRHKVRIIVRRSVRIRQRDHVRYLNALRGHTVP